MLQNLCDIKPLVPSERRKFVVYRMIGSYNWIRGDLITVCKGGNSSLNIYGNNSFKWSANKFQFQTLNPN